MAWLTGCSFRKPVTVTNPSASYQTMITVDSTAGADATNHAHCPGVAADFDDLRFTGADGGQTTLDYWIESISGTIATIWVENNATPDTTLYMYYGNPDAMAVSNGANTFPFFDDFSGTLTDKWTVSGTAANVGGICQITGAASYIIGKTFFGYGYAYRSYAKPLVATTDNAEVLRFCEASLQYGGLIIQGTTATYISLLTGATGWTEKVTTVPKTTSYMINEIRRLAANDVRYYLNNGAYYWQHTAGTITTDAALAIIAGSTTDVYADWALVCKVAATEPSFAFGRQETQVISASSLTAGTSITRKRGYPRSVKPGLAASSSVGRLTKWMRNTNSTLSLSATIRRIWDGVIVSVSTGLTAGTSVTKSFGKKVATAASLTVGTTIGRLTKWARAIVSGLQAAIGILYRPKAITQPPSLITASTARLNGKIKWDGGETCEARFRWSKSNADIIEESYVYSAPHGIVYYDGYVYTVHRNSASRLYKISATDYSSKSYITINVLSYLSDIIRVGDYLWVTCYDGKVYKVEISSFSVVDSYTIVSSNTLQSLCSDGTSIYVGGGSGILGKINISTGEVSTNDLGSQLWHSICEDGSYLYANDTTDKYLHKITKSDLSSVGSVSTTSACTDDTAQDANYVYLVREAGTAAILRVAKSDLALTTSSPLGMGYCYGVFNVNDNILCLEYSDGQIWVFDSALNVLKVATIVNGSSYWVCELATDGAYLHLMGWATGDIVKIRQSDIIWLETTWQNTLETNDTYYADITGLSAGTEYEFQAQAKNTSGEGQWSASRNFWTAFVTASLLTASTAITRTVAWTRDTSSGLTSATSILKAWGRSIVTSCGLTLSTTIGRLAKWARDTTSGLTAGTTISRLAKWVRDSASGLTAGVSITASAITNYIITLATSLSASVTITRTLDWARAVSSGLTAATSITRSRGRTIASSVGLTISTTIGRLVEWIRTTASSLSASVSITAIAELITHYLITTATNLSVVVSLTRKWAIKRAISSSLTASVSISRLVKFLRAIPNNLTLSPSINRAIAYVRDAPVGLVVSTSINRLAKFIRATASGLTIAVSVAKSRGWTVVTSTAIAVSVTVSRLVEWTRSTTSGLLSSVSIIATTAGHYLVVIATSLSVGVSITRAWAIKRATASGLTIATTLSRVWNRMITTTSNLSVSVGISRLVTWARETSSGLTASVSLSRLAKFIRVVPSNLSLAVSILRSRGWTITTSAGLTVSVSVSRLVNWTRVTASSVLLSVSISINQITNYLITLATNLAAGVSVSRVFKINRDISVNLNAQAVIDRLFKAIRRIGTGLTLSVTLSKVYGWVKTTSANLSASLTIKRTVEWFREIPTGLSAAVSILLGGVSNYLIQLGVNLSAAVTITRRWAITRAISSNLQVIVSLVRNIGMTIATSVGLTITSSINRTVEWFREISSSLTVAVSISKLAGFIRTISGNLDISVSVKRTVEWFREIPTNIDLGLSIIVNGITNTIVAIGANLSVVVSIARTVGWTRVIPSALDVIGAIIRNTEFYRTTTANLTIGLSIIYKQWWCKPLRMVVDRMQERRMEQARIARCRRIEK